MNRFLARSTRGTLLHVGVGQEGEWTYWRCGGSTRHCELPVSKLRASEMVSTWEYACASCVKRHNHEAREAAREIKILANRLADLVHYAAEEILRETPLLVSSVEVAFDVAERLRDLDAQEVIEQVLGDRAASR